MFVCFDTKMILVRVHCFQHLTDWNKREWDIKETPFKQNEDEDEAEITKLNEMKCNKIILIWFWANESHLSHNFIVVLSSFFLYIYIYILLATIVNINFIVNSIFLCLKLEPALQQKPMKQIIYWKKKKLWADYLIVNWTLYSSLKFNNKKNNKANRFVFLFSVFFFFSIKIGDIRCCFFSFVFFNRA